MDKNNFKPSPEQLAIIRKAYSDCAQSFCSAADLLEEPFKSQFLTFKNGVNTALEALPPTDQIPAAFEANGMLQSLLSNFISMNSMCSLLAAKVPEMRAAYAASLASAVDAEVNKRVTDGILLPATALTEKISAAVAEAKKDMTPNAEVQSLCAAAKQTGLTEGKTLAEQAIAAAAAEAAKVKDRETACSTAGIPLPVENILQLLGGPDDEYAVRRTAAEARKTELEGLGVSLSAADPIHAKIIWGDAAAYDNYKSLAKSFSGTPNPFATKPAGAAATPPPGLM